MDEKAIRYVLFSGAKSDWFMWREQFIAHASKKGYEGVLDQTYVVPKKTSAPFTKDEEKSNKLVKQAYTDLILSMDPGKTASRDVFRMICRTKTTEYPYGNVTDAWKQLCEMYEPTSNLSLIGLHKQFTSATMRMKANPDLYIGYLQDIASRINDIEDGKITDKDIMMKVINTLTPEYEHVQLKLEGDFNEDKLTVLNMKTELRIKYQRMIEKLPKQGYKKPDPYEKAMAAFTKQFKGKCWKCGKIGHKGSECKSGKEEKKNSGDSKHKFQGECGYCKKKGHKEADCFKKKRDQEREQAEVAAMAYEVQDEVFSFMAMECDEEETDNEEQLYYCQPTKKGSTERPEISSKGCKTMTAQEILKKDMEGGYKWFTWNEETDSECEDDMKVELRKRIPVADPTQVETTNECDEPKIEDVDMEVCLCIQDKYEDGLKTVFMEVQVDGDDFEQEIFAFENTGEPRIQVIPEDDEMVLEEESPRETSLFGGGNGENKSMLSMGMPTWLMRLK